MFMAEKRNKTMLGKVVKQLCKTRGNDYVHDVHMEARDALEGGF